MFDVNREVVGWCRRSYRWPHYRKRDIVELEDHLHCAVEKLVEQGLAPTDAFERAVAGLGESESLRNEYRKNWSRFSGAIRSIEVRPIQFTAVVVVIGVLSGGILFVCDGESIQWTRSMLVAIYSIPFKFCGVPS